MLRIKTTQRALGQYQVPFLQQPTYGVQASRLDPLVRVGLNTAGQVLSRSDPGAPQTMDLIQQLIEAPGWGLSTPTAPAKISDLNPALEVFVAVRTHPILTLLGVLSIPALAYIIGKRVGESARNR